MSLEGQYTITFSADSCQLLPPTLRTRTYDGVLKRYSPDGRVFTIELGAGFFPEYDTLWGNANADALTFYVFSWDAMNRRLDELPIVEQLEAGRSLNLAGTASGRLEAIETSSAELSATFSGMFSYCAGPVAGTPTSTSVQWRLLRARLRIIGSR